MSAEAKSYAIYDLKTGQLAAKISSDGLVQNAFLRRLPYISFYEARPLNE
jgi:hypothetical protein